MEDRAALIRWLLDSWRPVIGGNAVDLIASHIWRTLPAEDALAGAVHIPIGENPKAAVATLIALEQMAEGLNSGALAHWRREADGRHTLAGIEMPPAWHLQMRGLWVDVTSSPEGWGWRYLPVSVTAMERFPGQGELLVSVAGRRLDPPICVADYFVADQVHRLLADFCDQRGIRRGELELGVALVTREVRNALFADERALDLDAYAYAVYSAHLRDRLQAVLR